MDDDLDIKYLTELLQEGIDDIFAAQRMIIDENTYQVGHDRIREKRAGHSYGGRLGELKDAIHNPDYRLSALSHGVYSQINYPIQIRFLDMKRLGNWKIYNRQIWGILYKETFQKIRYSYRDWLREHTRQVIADAAKPLEK